MDEKQLIKLITTSPLKLAVKYPVTSLKGKTGSDNQTFCYETENLKPFSITGIKTVIFQKNRNITILCDQGYLKLWSCVE